MKEYELYSEVGDDGYAVLIKNSNDEHPFRLVSQKIFTWMNKVEFLI